MTSLADHQSSKFSKLLYIGDSGTGKTGSYVSLVQAGYKLRLLDLDNGLDALKAWIKKECPDKLSSVDYETVQDRFVLNTGVGAQIDPEQKTKAFVEAMKLMKTWSDGSKPQDWGENTFFIVDSLTSLGNEAFEFAKGLNPSSKDPRQWYAAAQEALESFVAAVVSEDFKCNVIITAHVRRIEMPDGTLKGWPTSIGKALGDVIPRYFNTMILAETIGSGENVKRKIKTVPTGIIDLKTPAPFAMSKEYDLGSGLATIVKVLKEN